MIEQIERRHFWIDAEFLRKIAEQAARGVFIGDQIERVQMGAAGIRLKQRGQDFHQRGFAGAIRSQQAEHARRNFQADALQRADSARISFCKILDGEHFGSWLLARLACDLRGDCIGKVVGREEWEPVS